MLVQRCDMNITARQKKWVASAVAEEFDNKGSDACHIHFRQT
jgi:hypothetical protein